MVMQQKGTAKQKLLFSNQRVQEMIQDAEEVRCPEVDFELVNTILDREVFSFHSEADLIQREGEKEV